MGKDGIDRTELIISQNGRILLHTLPGCLLLVLITVCTLWQDLVYLFACPYPYGIDGYFYLGMATAALPDFSFYGSPLATDVIWCLARVIPPVAAIKVAGLLFLFVSSWLALVTVYRLTASLWGGILAYGLVLKGFMHIELLIDFLKQSLGQGCLWAMLFFLVCFLQRRSRWNMLGIMVSLIAAAMSHALTGVIGVIFLTSLGLVFAARLVIRRHAFLTVCTGGLVVPVLATALLSKITPYIKGPMQYFLQFSFSSHPQWNMASAYDTFGGNRPVVPMAAVMTVLLLTSVIFCAVQGLRLDQHARFKQKTNKTTGRLNTMDERAETSCLVGIVMFPLVSLCYSPFVVSAQQNTLTIHLRLLCALSIPAAILIPCAIESLPSNKLKYGIFVCLIPFFGLTSPFWQGFPGPPEDGGKLHEAMVKIKGLVPRKAVIVVPDITTGNMVKALWGNTYLLESAPGRTKREDLYYWFVRLDAEEFQRLQLYREQQGHPPPVGVLGPWILLREDFYRDLHENLRIEQSSLYDSLQNDGGKLQQLQEKTGDKIQ